MWTIKPEHLDLMEKAKRFMENYYRAFDEDRAGLMKLYREESVLAWHGREIKGKEAIIAKLTSLPQCHHEITEFNCRPQRTPGSVAVRVSGETWIGGKNDKAEAVVSHQVFILFPAPEGSFFVGIQSWSPRDLTKQRTSLLALQMSASVPIPLLPLPTAMTWYHHMTSLAYVSAPALRKPASASSLALPMSMMKISSASAGAEWPG
ncbi:hypothetical protein BT93_H2768 [Corymbia citriodora subsp. variegata]|nr:hypothetical protein BT93_H2768 [Corymbia citriodora subsp. variegata]